MRDNRLKLGRVSGAVIAVAGMVSLLATYWDDAWHTDLGRDDATIPPHLLLYGSVAVAGVVVVGWGVRLLIQTRSLPAVLGQSPLVVAAAGGAATLAAAPLDAIWHASFGRDAVLWSPPHMLVVLASAAMVLGAVAGVRQTRSGVVEALLAGLLLGGLAMTVLEYETDVPQFSEAFYLPVLLSAGLPAAAVARRVVPLRMPVTAMVVVYVALRLVTTAVLALLGRSTPELPLAVLGLCVLDLPWRNRLLRYSAGAAAVAALAWLAAAIGLVDRSASAVAAVAVPAIAVFVLAGLVSARRGALLVPAVFAVVLSGVLLVGSAPTASAHDPGQGEPVIGARLTGASDGKGELSLAVETTSSCERTSPVRLVARRAGSTLTAPLRAAGDCRYTGTVQVSGSGRWFVYAELRDGEHNVEAWLPLPADQAIVSTETRDLYRPAAATAATRPVQIAAGTAIYAFALILLGWATVMVVRRRRPGGVSTTTSGV
ncbi:hypothetical protein [Nocardia barduliensis]|uniref:hypothetical protein n=1 Tax=Nocardia barduliensis TaxID=2736643 RepID=UPI001FE27828|nr:hypothetical protein [Nocardia barduliensis]